MPLMKEIGGCIDLTRIKTGPTNLSAMPPILATMSCQEVKGPLETASWISQGDITQDQQGFLMVTMLEHRATPKSPIFQALRSKSDSMPQHLLVSTKLSEWVSGSTHRDSRLPHVQV